MVWVCLIWGAMGWLLAAFLTYVCGGLQRKAELNRSEQPHEVSK